MTVIHSSHTRKMERLTTSAKIINIPDITAVRVAVVSKSNRRAHGEMHSQIPSNQLHQSSHCLGGENFVAATICLLGLEFCL